MRKASEYLIIAALAIMTLAGCSNGDNEPELSGGNDSPVFTATISGEGSRAYDRQWEAGDVIGISGANRTNVGYHTNDGSGKFAVKTPGDQIYFPDDKEVIFTAYYPWNNLAAGAAAINADTSDQTGQKSFDFLWVQATGKKVAPLVAFNFSHTMAKLVLTVKCGANMSYDELNSATLSLAGIRHTGTFDITTGTAKANDNAAAGECMLSDAVPVTADVAGKAVTYSLIFFPQEFNESMTFSAALPDGNLFEWKHDFTDANKTKDGNKAGNRWVAGRQYNLSITLHKTGFTPANCTIKPWNGVDKEITAD